MTRLAGPRLITSCSTMDSRCSGNDRVGWLGNRAARWGKTAALPLIVTLLLTLHFAMPAHAADWKAKEHIKHYSISGTTGRALYVSIGQKGPRVGGRRAIAHTTFDLKWRRKYVPKGKTCRLVSARPFFTIIYTVPKPAAKLTGATARQWKTFATGMMTHERVHGEHARQMVDKIIATTVGMTTKNDPQCRKIRRKVLARVKTAYRDYGAKAGAFDRAELAAVGNVRMLVQGLVRGR